MSRLSKHLAGLKKKYILERETAGGTAHGFGEYLGREYQNNQLLFADMILDAVLEAGRKAWERPPRRGGPDLFTIAGYEVPEYFTRPTNGYIPNQEAGDDNEGFEKVDAKYATVQDMIDDATIHLRKAAQASSAAAAQMDAADEARRRARNNLATFLRDIADDRR